LVKNYQAIIPPTIARKKRESERKIPIRKRTAPVDMRLSRSRISVGADTKQLLAAQQAAQNPSLRSKHGPSDSISDVPPVPPLPPSVVAPPPPPPADKTEAPAPVAPVPVKADTSGRPQFKEPPPEDDDLPPRPTFKEPPPETPDSPPPMPKFAEPAAEETEQEAPKPTSPAVGVIPPTPQKTKSPVPRSGSQSPVKGGTGRSTSPPTNDPPRTSLSRGPSGASSVVRGPRISKGPRPPGGSSVSSMVSNLNRQSSATATAAKRLSGSPARTPSPARQAMEASRGKHIKRGSFSSRTMASDAEDELVRK
jgi:hypothetical protein